MSLLRIVSHRRIVCMWYIRIIRIICQNNTGHIQKLREKNGDRGGDAYIGSWTSGRKGQRDKRHRDKSTEEGEGRSRSMGRPRSRGG